MIRGVDARRYAVYTETTLYGVLLAVGAVSIFLVHSRHGLALGLAYAAAITLGVLWLAGRPARSVTWRVLGATWMWVALLLLTAAVDQRHFPKTERSPDPLTSSFALELPARLLWHGHEPYAAHLPGGAPVSPGPGWILLLSPLTVPGWTGVLAMTALAVVCVVFARRSRAGAGLFVLLLLLQPIFQSQAANGQDLYVVSCSLVLLSLLLDRDQARRGALILLGVAGGVVATSRLPMLAIVFLLAVGVYRRRAAAGVIFGSIAITVAMALHAGFAYWAHLAGHNYPPMHVIRRASTGTSAPERLVFELLAVVVFGALLLRIRSSVTSWMLCMYALMTALFVPEALHELALKGGDLRWEGSHYITFPLPLLAAVLALTIAARREGGENLAVHAEPARSTAPAQLH